MLITWFDSLFFFQTFVAFRHYTIFKNSSCSASSFFPLFFIIFFRSPFFCLQIKPYQGNCLYPENWCILSRKYHKNTHLYVSKKFKLLKLKSTSYAFMPATLSEFCQSILMAITNAYWTFQNITSLLFNDQWLTSATYEIVAKKTIMKWSSKSDALN